MKHLLIAALMTSLVGGLPLHAEASSKSKAQLQAEIKALKKRPPSPKIRYKDYPVPRFVNNRDGTVTDRLTGLMWMREVGCISVLASRTYIDETRARLLDLRDGTSTCKGYERGKYDDWRIAGIRYW